MIPGRSLISWLLLILFGIVSCAGQGLHLLPGAGHCEHGSLHQHADEQPTHSHAHGGCTHQHAAHSLAQSPPAQSPGKDAFTAAHAADCGDACAICAFFAQGQLHVCTPLPLVSGTVQLQLAAVPERPSLGAPRGVHSPRAPPRLA